MTTVGIRNLKNSLSQYLHRVKSGERVVITDHNRIIAELVPYTGASSSSDLLTEYLDAQVSNGSITKPTKRTRIGKRAGIIKNDDSLLEEIYSETRSERK